MNLKMNYIGRDFISNNFPWEMWTEEIKNDKRLLNMLTEK